MTEIIKNDTHSLSNDILEVIVHTLEDKNIKVCSCYQDGQNVYGIYIGSVFNTLSFLHMVEKNIITEIDGYNIIFLELGSVLQYIYQKGDMSLYNILIQPTDIDCCIDDVYNMIIDLVKNNPPLHIAKLQLESAIQRVLEDDDSISLMNVIKEIDAFCQVTDITLPIFDWDSQAKFNNALSRFLQELKSQQYQKISQQKIIDIDKIFVNLQIIYYEYFYIE